MVVHRVLEEDLLVDLVGHDDEVVAACDVDEALDDVLGVHGARGVVRVDDDDGVRVLGDLALDVRKVRVPPVLLVAQVVHGLAAGERHGTRPQGVVGGGNEDLVTVVDEGLQHHADELRDAVADEDVIDERLAQAAALVVLRDGGARRVDAAAVAVALRVVQVVLHVGQDCLRCLEAERGGVADVQLEDLVALGLEALGLFEDRTAHVVTHVLKLLGLTDRTHAPSVSQGGAQTAPDTANPDTIG